MGYEIGGTSSNMVVEILRVGIGESRGRIRGVREKEDLNMVE